MNGKELPASAGRVFRYPDGRHELLPDDRLRASRLYNHDLAPVEIARRKWTTYNFAALWIGMAHCIPTYMLAASLIALGMSWKQALLTILLGNTIVLVPMLMNSHPGTKYGIPFPVFARASYGVFGSNLPALMRALVACGWFGIQTWIGGAAVHLLLRSVWPAWGTFGPDPAGLPFPFTGHALGEWVSFLAFWGLNILIIYRGMDTVRRFENWAAPFVLVATGALLWWAVRSAHGFGPLLADAGKLNAPGEFFKVFVPSLTAMIGYWATLSLNMPDFTRFGRSQRDQAWGQALALPPTMTVFSAMGVMITSATVLLYGRSIWDPVELVGTFKNPLIVLVSMFTVAVATLSVNIAANVVSPANDFSNAWPRRIDFKTGGLVTGVIGILIMPWRLLADPQGYVFSWLVGYSGGLGSIAGVLIADYWVVRRTILALPDLYLEQGVYRYRNGWNLPAVAATLLGCVFAWGGKVFPFLAPLYPYAWFVGFGVAFLTYLVFTDLVRRARALPQI